MKRFMQWLVRIAAGLVILVILAVGGVFALSSPADPYLPGSAETVRSA
jgi:hypothetical protein